MGIYISEIAAQSISDLGYIYGTVTTTSNKQYEGYLRWGKEEVAWHDVFNSTKLKNKYQKPENKKSSWRNINWSLSSLWSNNYSGSTRAFACLFGDIAKLEIKKSDRVNVFFKNGQSIEVQGGSNDIGASIVMNDTEIGRVKIDWDKIKVIEFSAPPRGRLPHYDMALYGTLATRKGQEMQGYIKWDLDERLTTDILDGDNCCYSDEMPFSNITKIQNNGQNSLVTLANGKEIEMSGTNDVNSSNRGIGIYIEEVGNVQIPWEEFRQVIFDHRTIAGSPYDHFQIGDHITVEVATYDDQVHKGIMVFDLDEMYGAEMLDGYDGQIEYQIPMRNISKIIPKNDDYSIVILHNGLELLLGNTQDVSDSNDGILILGNGKEETYTPWDKIKSIQCKLE